MYKIFLRKFKANYYTVLVVLLLLCFVVSAYTFVYAESELGYDKAKVVWSATYKEKEQVFFSEYNDNEWSLPILLSKAGEMAFQPTVSFGTNNETWVVWSQYQGNRSLLYYATCTFSRCSDPTLIKTGLVKNKNATIVLSSNNTPIVAWISSTKKYPDIFWSWWNGKRWEVPQKVNPSNDVPDLEPSLAIDDHDNVVLSWKTVANGRYVNVYRRWNGQIWVQLTAAELLRFIQWKKEFKRKLNLPIYPKFQQEFRSLSVSVQNSNGKCTIVLPSL